KIEKALPRSGLQELSGDGRRRNHRASRRDVVSVALAEHNFAGGDLMESALLNRDLAVHEDRLRDPISEAEVLVPFPFRVKIYLHQDLTGESQAEAGDRRLFSSHDRVEVRPGAGVDHELGVDAVRV